MKLKKFKRIEFLLFLILLVPLIFSPVNNYVFELPKIAFLSIVSCIILIILFLKRKELKINILAIPLIIIFCLYLLSFTWSKSRYLCFRSIMQFYTFIIVLIIFLNLINLKNIEDIFRYLIYITLIISLYSLLQFSGIDFGFWSGNIGKKTMFSTIGNPTTLAEFIILIIPITFYFIVKSIKKREKFLYLLSFILLSIVVILTFSKILWFVLFIEYLIFLLFFIRKLKISKLITLIFIFLIISVSILQLPQTKKFVNIRTIKEGFKNRIFICNTTLKLIKQHPFGIGAGQFPLIYKREYINYLNNPGEYAPEGIVVKRAHNEFLQIALEGGIIGLILFLFILFEIFFIIYKVSKSKDFKKYSRIFIPIFFALLIDSIFNFPLRNISFILVLVFMSSFLIKSIQNASFKLNKKLILFLLILIFITTFFHLKFLVADTYYLKAINGINDLKNAENSLEIAHSFNNADGEICSLLGAVYLGSGQIDNGIKKLERSLNSFIDFNIYYNLGLAYQWKGEYDKSNKFLKKALKMDYRSDDAKNAYIRNLINMEKYDEAHNFIKENYTREKEILISEIYFKIGDIGFSNMHLKNYLSYIGLKYRDGMFYPEYLLERQELCKRKDVNFRSIINNNTIDIIQKCKMLSMLGYYSKSSSLADRFPDKYSFLKIIIKSGNHYKSGEYEKSLSLLNDLFKYDLTKEYSELINVLILFINGEYDKVVDFRIKQREKLEYKVLKGFSYYNLGYYNKALNVFLGLEKYGDNVLYDTLLFNFFQYDIIKMIGDIYLYKDDFNNSLNYYKKCIKLNPFSSYYYNAIARYYFAQDRYSESLIWSYKAYELNNKDFETNLMLSRAKYFLKIDNMENMLTLLNSSYINPEILTEICYQKYDIVKEDLFWDKVLEVMNRDIEDIVNYKIDKITDFGKIYNNLEKTNYSLDLDYLFYLSHNEKLGKNFEICYNMMGKYPDKDIFLLFYSDYLWLDDDFKIIRKLPDINIKKLKQVYEQMMNNKEKYTFYEKYFIFAGYLPTSK